ncbi:WD40-repeat-containing domain protein [Dichotomocladium elegans]|nr:WD40-repeat-containing domain protein [Dichotomocladium elegans]
MYSFLKKREYGDLRPTKFIRAEATKRAYSLQLSPFKQVERIHRGPVQSIKIERIEQRYMLSGGADGLIHVYDLNASFSNEDDYPSIIKPLQSVSRQHRHHYAVTSISWYPFDTGIFISSSFDQSIRVWDTNSMTPACSFQLDSRIYCQAISSIASHCLVASKYLLSNVVPNIYHKEKVQQMNPEYVYAISNTMRVCTRSVAMSGQFWRLLGHHARSMCYTQEGKEDEAGGTHRLLLVEWHTSYSKMIARTGPFGYGTFDRGRRASDYLTSITAKAIIYSRTRRLRMMDV